MGRTLGATFKGEKMIRNIPIKKPLIMAGLLAVLFFLVGFAERMQSDETCKEVIVRIENQTDNHFIDERDILQLVTDHGKQPLVGRTFGEINLRELEERILRERFISKVYVYRDHSGYLIVKAWQRRPLARIVRQDAPDAYIGTDGTLLPVSDKFSARVVLLSGPRTDQFKERNLYESDYGRQLMDMLHYMRNHAFWQAQIAQMELDRKGNIILMPQVGRQIIEFGPPEEVKAKFKKLELFYLQVLPQKGWNHYTRVNLKYENQIVAE
jgi:cell division protein FtsQ